MDINDNKNFAPSLFLSLCEFVVDCFGPLYSFLGPKQSPPISHNDLKKDGAQLLLSNWSLIIMMSIIIDC